MRLYVYGAFAAVFVIGQVFIVCYAYNAGKQSVISSLQSDRIKVLEDGKEIDAAVLSADDSALECMLYDCK